jgi:hypothetical protein
MDTLGRNGIHCGGVQQNTLGENLQQERSGNRKVVRESLLGSVIALTVVLQPDISRMFRFGQIHDLEHLSTRLVVCVCKLL